MLWLKHPNPENQWLHHWCTSAAHAETPLHTSPSHRKVCVLVPDSKTKEARQKGTALIATYLRDPTGSGTKYHCGEASNPQTTVAQDMCPHGITWDKESSKIPYPFLIVISCITWWKYETKTEVDPNLQTVGTSSTSIQKLPSAVQLSDKLSKHL